MQNVNFGVCLSVMMGGRAMYLTVLNLRKDRNNRDKPFSSTSPPGWWTSFCTSQIGFTLVFLLDP